MSKLEIKNVGKAIVHWHFVQKLDESAVCKPWITLSADSGLLLPGEVSARALVMTTLIYANISPLFHRPRSWT